MKANNCHLKIRTDESFCERIAHGTDNYPFSYYLEDIYQFDFHCIDWHWHPELEFVYLKTGTANIWAGNNQYTLTPGNAIFINNQVIHFFESSESTIIPNIVFSPLLLAPINSLIYQQYIQPILSSSVDCHIFSRDIPWQKNIINILKSIFSLQDTEKPCELETVQLIFKLWQILYENVNIVLGNENKNTNIQNQTRLQILLKYIHDNYQSNISLEHLTQLTDLSKSSILNLFNEYVHMTPINYVIHYKLKKAAQLLDTTENTIVSIAQSTGFDNTGYFCRKFKDVFQLTPSEYRNSKRECQGNLS